MEKYAAAESHIIQAPNVVEAKTIGKSSFAR
jgi:hypothetical protein